MGSKGWSVLVVTSFILMGCATTGRNHQTDIDALNARINALQGQMAEKDNAIAKLQNEVNDQRLAREAAESAMRRTEGDRGSMQSSQAQKSSYLK